MITPSAWSKLYRRECIKDIQFPKGKLCEDILYTTKAFYRAKKVIYIDRELYFYRNRPGSIMTESTVINRRIKEEIEQYEARIDFLREKREEDLMELCCYELYRRIQLRYCEVSKKETNLNELTIELLHKMKQYREIAKKVNRKRLWKYSYREKVKMRISLSSPQLYSVLSNIIN